MEAPTDNAAPGKRIAFYAHRAKPYAQEAEFSLFADHVAIEQGRRSGTFPLREIVMVRLLYKPRNTTNEGYAARIYRRDKRTATVTNLSWKSLVDMERQDADYRHFVEAMIIAIHRANPGVILQAGMPRWLHLATSAAGLVAVLALVSVIGQAVSNRSIPVAVATGLLALYLGWWAIRYISRNRPRGFEPRSIPEEVLPKIPAVKP